MCRHVCPVRTAQKGHISLGFRNEICQSLTSVSRDVLPEPLGPIRRKDGRVVAEAERYNTKCRKRGMESTTSAVMVMTKSEGSIIEDSQLCESVQDGAIFLDSGGRL